MSDIKCMIIVSLTLFSLNLVTISAGELHKVHDCCVFDYFLFNLVTISAGELLKVHDCCVFDYFLFNLVTVA